MSAVASREGFDLAWWPLPAQIRAEKDALAKKLKAMESKILKGDAAGGLAEITRKKEEELKRKEQELERRCAHSYVRACGPVGCMCDDACAQAPRGCAGGTSKQHRLLHYGT